MSADDRLDNDQTAIAESEKTGNASKRFTPLIIYGLIAAIMAGAGYFAGSLFMRPAGEEKPAIAGEEKEEPRKTPQELQAGEVFMMEDIIVNPSGTGGTRFLSVSIGFEVSSPETAELLEEREPVIKDALITILGSKTIEQLSDTREREITRYQIKKRIEKILRVEDLMAVYFTDFILQ